MSAPASRREADTWTVDDDIDAVYVCVRTDPIHMTVEIADGVNVDLDHNGQIVGVEVYG